MPYFADETPIYPAEEFEWADGTYIDGVSPLIVDVEAEED